VVNGDVLQNRISAWLTGYGDPEFARSAQCARGCPGAAGDLPIERRQAFGHFHCLGSSQRSAHAEMSAVPEREVRAARPRRIEQSRAMATASSVSSLSGSTDRRSSAGCLRRSRRRGRG